ncbi:MAG: tRNA 4-thiouridine(8) synthase ThiI [Lentisphaerae bacterium]|nr:tRNA 4-thiouridine(8) synthase ThiI [Lentisphaerota bacterium]
MMETGQIRALSLLSGGLDSQLAICILKDQAVDVHGIAFDSPFFCIAAAEKAAVDLNIPLHVVNFTADIVSLLSNPKHGFGSCLNPCVDCHALMLRRAGELMEEIGCHFLSTGEVLNERPMSQNFENLAIVAKESGYADVIVRPLSAGLLPATRPEKEGWIDRSRLLSLAGRSRRSQFKLAEEYALKNYPSPAGGCRLTEPNYAKRLMDLRDHEGLHGVGSIMLLRFGRHFRLADKVKLIVGRNENDNVYLEGNAELYDIVLKIEEVPGPTGLMPLTSREDHVRLGAAICARYCDAPGDSEVTVRIRSSRGMGKIKVLPATPEQINHLRI